MGATHGAPCRAKKCRDLRASRSLSVSTNPAFLIRQMNYLEKGRATNTKSKTHNTKELYLCFQIRGSSFRDRGLSELVSGGRSVRGAARHVLGQASAQDPHQLGARRLYYALTYL